MIIFKRFLSKSTESFKVMRDILLSEKDDMIEGDLQFNNFFESFSAYQ